jgi:serine/threonine protein kinase
MAYLDGVQLDLWLAGHANSGEPPPGPIAVLDAFLQAGEGLAAAQEAGLMHLDFKPSNVFRERRGGQIVVLDFGLARVSVPTEGSAHTFAGTPKYMAPEQWLGAPEAASDQFAFCVALYEALWRHHPFGEADGVIARMSSVLESEPRDPPSTRHVPVHVWPTLRRGMARDPRQRFASMRELVNALERR